MDKLNGDILRDALQKAGWADTHEVFPITDRDFHVRRKGYVPSSYDFDVWMQIDAPAIKAHDAEPSDVHTTISWAMDGIFVSFRDTMVEVASLPKISMADPNSFQQIAEAMNLAIVEGAQKYAEVMRAVDAGKSTS